MLVFIRSTEELRADAKAALARDGFASAPPEPDGSWTRLALFDGRTPIGFGAFKRRTLKDRANLRLAFVDKRHKLTAATDVVNTAYALGIDRLVYIGRDETREWWREHFRAIYQHDGWYVEPSLCVSDPEQVMRDHYQRVAEFVRRARIEKKELDKVEPATITARRTICDKCPYAEKDGDTVVACGKIANVADSRIEIVQAKDGVTCPARRWAALGTPAAEVRR